MNIFNRIRNWWNLLKLSADDKREMKLFEKYLKYCRMAGTHEMPYPKRIMMESTIYDSVYNKTNKQEKG